MIKDTRMEKLIIVLVCIGLVMLDNSLMPFFAIKGSCPSLLFTFAIGYSLVNNRANSVFVGVVSGMLQDVFFFNGFGVNSLLNLLLCFLMCVISESMLKNKTIIPVTSMFVVTVLKFIGVFTIFYLLNIKIEFARCIITGIYNSVVMFFMYKILANIYDDEYTNQQWRFK